MNLRRKRLKSMDQPNSHRRIIIPPRKTIESRRSRVSRRSPSCQSRLPVPTSLPALGGMPGAPISWTQPKPFARLLLNARSILAWLGSLLLSLFMPRGKRSAIRGPSLAAADAGSRRFVDPFRPAPVAANGSFFVRVLRRNQADSIPACWLFVHRGPRDHRAAAWRRPCDTAFGPSMRARWPRFPMRRSSARRSAGGGGKRM